MYKEYPKVSYEETYEYLRKSRSDDPLLTVEEVLKKHEIMLEDFAVKFLGGKIPENQILREVASSETIDDRPKMIELLKIIESPKVKAVLIMEVQRLSRGDLEDAGRIIKLFRYTNTLVITPQKTYDLRDEYDRDAFERELKRGNEYLEYAKKVMNRGKLIAVSEGNYIATYPPYGYKKIHYKENKRKCSTLEIIETEAEVVRMVYDLYLNGDMGFIKIANYLNDLGIKPAVCERWKKHSIQDIISNVTYTGKVRWQYRKTIKSVENQEVVKSRPRTKLSEYLVFEGKHEAIISDETFKLAQEKRGKNVPIRKNMSIVNPLAGIFFCAKCGHAMKLRPANGKNKARYECLEMKYCGNGSATQDDVLERIYEVLEQCIKNYTIEMSSNNLDEVEKHQSLINMLEKKMKELEAKEISQWEKYTEEGMPKHIFDTLNKKVLQEKEEINEALCSAYNNTPQKIDYEVKIFSFQNALEALKDDKVDANTKNKFLREILENITFERQKPIRLTKKLAEEMNVPYPHPLCFHNYPFELDINIRG